MKAMDQEDASDAVREVVGFAKWLATVIQMPGCSSL